MDFLISISDMDSSVGLEIGPWDLLPANSPPPLDPGADDEMDEADDVEYTLLDQFKVATPTDTQSLDYWTQYKKQSGGNNASPQTAEKDNIAIVQELPPSLESKRLFSDILTSEIPQLNSNNSTLPWDAFVQSHLQCGHVPDKFKKAFKQPTHTQASSGAVQSTNTKSPEDFLLTSSLSDSSLLDLSQHLSSDMLDKSQLSSPSSFFDMTLTNTPIKQELPSVPLQKNFIKDEPPFSPLPSSHSHSLSVDSSSSSTGPETVRTEEERKRRNRVYAKRSRDLKNLKYKEALDLNKDLQSRLKALQEDNKQLKLRNQRLEFEAKESKRKFEIIEQEIGLVKLQAMLNRDFSQSILQKPIHVKTEDMP